MSSVLTRSDSAYSRTMVAPGFGVESVRDMQLVACSQPGVSTEVASWCGLGSVTQGYTTDNSQWKTECT